MSYGKRQMKFAVFMSGDSNYHLAGWRLPEAYADAGMNLKRWIEFAHTMERGKLDMLFIADATHDKAAWFNFGPEADSRVRRIWQRMPSAAPSRVAG